MPEIRPASVASLAAADPRRPPRPLLLFDGDCGFCRCTADRLRHRTGPAVDYRPYQGALESFPQIGAEQFASAVHLVLPDGTISRGAEAILRTLACARGRGLGLWLYLRLPGMRPIADRLYRFVADHRPRMTRFVCRRPARAT